ncbi:hypothetical protein BP5796_01842 [Coleophoma crateriformis]|uniref:PHD-type domain-containing protein n=1 Tax=Coleophoma crateriformis TaxID=565419 RepID=A0A3D8T378_9HELO|nr:hypothetical protein BP5796_01842 [Coleophoma crateriformis]
MEVKLRWTSRPEKCTLDAVFGSTQGWTATHTLGMSQKKSIKDFFKPPSKTPTTSKQSTKSNATSSRPPSTSATGSKATLSGGTLMSQKNVRSPTTSQSQVEQPHQPSFTSLSSAPSSLHTVLAFSDGQELAMSPSSDTAAVPLEALEIAPDVPVIARPEMVIKDSDDEDSDLDSDDELPDFLGQLQSKSGAANTRSMSRPRTPPRTARAHKLASFHSPLTVQSKKMFDFNSLIQEAKIDDATEASSKRLKALLSDSKKSGDDPAIGQDDVGIDNVMKKGELLDLLTEDLDEEEAQKRKEVLKKSQGGTAEKRWYFFDTKSRPSSSDSEAGNLRSNRASSTSRSATLESEGFLDCLCGEHGKIDDGSHSISCDKCNRWQHSECVGVNEVDAGNPEFSFLCRDCMVQKTPPDRTAFPLAAVTESWKAGLTVPEVRRHTLVSGMAENMVTLGRTLPDEILSWMLDELCFEKDALLREVYVGILVKSPSQVHRLINDEAVQDLFRKLGGTTRTTSLAHKILPVKELTSPYPYHDWANLRSIVKLLGRLSGLLSQQTRQYVINMLLRLGADTVLLHNVDLIHIAHNAMTAFCEAASEPEWEICVGLISLKRPGLLANIKRQCPQICSSVFTSIEHINIRLQVIKCIPSMTQRTRDIKRRLATACFFGDISYCHKDIYVHNDINKYTNHLTSAQEFKIGRKTDFHEVAARISLLDIAVNDGQHAGFDLSSKQVVELHNEDIVFLGRRIKAIYQAIPTDISATLDRRIEAKIAMEVVAYRIQSLTLNRPKPKTYRLVGKEDFEQERSGMSSFLKKRPNLLGVGTPIDNANS